MPGRILVFDLDGTLSDPREGIIKSLNYALETLGRAPMPESALTRYIGPPLTDIFRELLNTDDETRVARGIALFRQRYLAVGYRENQVYPGIRGLLKDLKRRGDRLYIVTAKREDTANNVARHFRLSEFFEKIYGTSPNRTKVEALKQILDRNGQGANEAWMIGDRRTDIEAGIQAGMRTIGVQWGFGEPSELAEADIIVSSLGELMEILTG